MSGRGDRSSGPAERGRPGLRIEGRLLEGSAEAARARGVLWCQYGSERRRKPSSDRTKQRGRGRRRPPV